jgi:hypothetical protein
LPTPSIARPSKNYPNWEFWFENMPSGKPGLREPNIGVSFAFLITARAASKMSNLQKKKI